jgi:hypothetical protein
MATTLTAPIHARKSIEVRLENDPTSTGSVLLTGGWVPKDQRMQPQTRSVAIARGASDGLEFHVPDFDKVRRLSVTVSLGNGELAWLEVFEGDDEIVSQEVAVTTTFEIPVDP